MNRWVWGSVFLFLSLSLIARAHNGPGNPSTARCAEALRLRAASYANAVENLPKGKSKESFAQILKLDFKFEVLRQMVVYFPNVLFIVVDEFSGKKFVLTAPEGDWGNGQIEAVIFQLEDEALKKTLLETLHEHPQSLNLPTVGAGKIIALAKEAVFATQKDRDKEIERVATFLLQAQNEVPQDKDARNLSTQDPKLAEKAITVGKPVFIPRLRIRKLEIKGGKDDLPLLNNRLAQANLSPNIKYIFQPSLNTTFVSYYPQHVKPAGARPWVIFSIPGAGADVSGIQGLPSLFHEVRKAIETNSKNSLLLPEFRLDQIVRMVGVALPRQLGGPRDTANSKDSKFNDPEFFFKWLAECLKTVIAENPEARVLVFGRSSGGGYAPRLAAMFSDQVHALAAMGATVPGDAEALKASADDIRRGTLTAGTHRMNYPGMKLTDKVLELINWLESGLFNLPTLFMTGELDSQVSAKEREFIRSLARQHPSLMSYVNAMRGGHDLVGQDVLFSSGVRSLSDDYTGSVMEALSRLLALADQNDHSVLIPETIPEMTAAFRISEGVTAFTGPVPQQASVPQKRGQALVNDKGEYVTQYERFRELMLGTRGGQAFTPVGEVYLSKQAPEDRMVVMRRETLPQLFPRQFSNVRAESIDGGALEPLESAIKQGQKATSEGPKLDPRNILYSFPRSSRQRILEFLTSPATQRGTQAIIPLSSLEVDTFEVLEKYDWDILRLSSMMVPLNDYLASQGRSLDAQMIAELKSKTARGQSVLYRTREGEIYVLSVVASVRKKLPPQAAKAPKKGAPQKQQASGSAGVS